MARKNESDRAVPAKLWTESSSAPPPLRHVLSQLAHFFERLGYAKTLDTLLAEASAHGVTADVKGWERGVSGDVSATLMAMWEAWREEKDGFPKLPARQAEKKEKKRKKEVKQEVKSEADEGSSDDSSDASSESESEDEETEGHKAGVVDDEAESTSDEDSDGSDEEGAAVAQAGTKRKREATPDSSDESASEDASSSDGSSDEEGARAAKRVKTMSQDDSSNDDSSSASSASDAPGGVDVDSDSSSASSDSESDSDSSDSSSSDSSDSDSDDSSSSDESSESDSSDSESSASPPPKKKAKLTVKKPTPDATDSASSATLAGSPKKTDAKPIKTSEDELLVPASAIEPSTNGEMHPDRLKRMPDTTPNVNMLKKGNVPFSRIPQDTAVDPRFASNDYVSYDYADRAFKDLSVTKGKGFTKEKNKKKRASKNEVTKPAPQQPKKRLTKKQRADKRDWEADYHAAFSESPPSTPEGRGGGRRSRTVDYDYDDMNPFGLKEDTWAFMSGVGYDPLSNAW